jgi:DNA primase
VSTLVSWDEVKTGFKLADFTIETMPERIQVERDLLKALPRMRQTLPEIA